MEHALTTLFKYSYVLPISKQCLGIGALKVMSAIHYYVTPCSLIEWKSVNI
jgi:hypothetical protein